jgi:colanic acid biosynthesis glycosyl transferase WcaI
MRKTVEHHGDRLRAGQRTGDPARGAAVSDIGALARSILLVTQYFYPELGGTAQQLTDLAAGLQRRGMRVCVLTGQLTYARGPKLARREAYHEVSIERLPMPYLDRVQPAMRAASAGLFTLAVLFRLLVSRGREPLLIVTNPPTLPLVGLILKRLRGQRYICLVHDIYPDIAVRLRYLRAESLVARMWGWCNGQMYSAADHVIVLGSCMEKTVRRKIGSAAPARITVIPNWADGEAIVPRAKADNWFSARYATRDKLTVLYAGNMGLFHDLDTLLEAARRLREFGDIQFLFVGDGGQRDRLVARVREWSLSNVRVLPYQPREHLPYLLTSGDLAAVTLARGTEGLAVPGKLYTALAAGQAILAVVGPESDVAQIVEEWRCGVRIDQGDAEAAVAALLRLRGDPAALAEMQRNARLCFEARFTMDRSVDQYFEVLNRIEGA